LAEALLAGALSPPLSARQTLCAAACGG
jgi:hypothetical protein